MSIPSWIPYIWPFVNSKHSISEVKEAILHLWVSWWGQAENCTFKDILTDCVVTLTFKYISDLLNFRELFLSNTSERKHKSLVLLDLKRQDKSTECGECFLSVTLCKSRSEAQSIIDELFLLVLLSVQRGKGNQDAMAFIPWQTQSCTRILDPSWCIKQWCLVSFYRRKHLQVFQIWKISLQE